MSSESPAQEPAAALPLLVSRSKSATEVVAPYTSMDAYSEVWESDCDPEDCTPGQQPLVSIFCIRGTYLHATFLNILSHAFAAWFRILLLKNRMKKANR